MNTVYRFRPVYRFPHSFALRWSRSGVNPLIVFRKSLCLGRRLSFSQTLFTVSKQRGLFWSTYPLAASAFVTGRKLSKNSNAADNATQKALDDDEFRDLLNDFARDFGVGDESVKILEDIKKEQENKHPVKERDKAPDSKSVEPDIKETLTSYRELVKDRYKEFKDRDSKVILSSEELANLDLDESFFRVDQKRKKTEKRLAKRGVQGVYDVHELVAVLREENLMDIAVIKIPESYHYVDYMVLANAKSPRHARAVLEFIVQFYKKKKHKSDPYVIIEGEKYGSWSAIDMGNIVLHVFLEDARACYDLESLWLLDSKFDTGGQIQQDEFMDIMQDEMEFLNCLQSDNMLSTNTTSTPSS